MDTSFDTPVVDEEENFNVKVNEGNEEKGDKGVDAEEDDQLNLDPDNDGDLDPFKDDLGHIFNEETKEKRKNKHNIQFETFVCDIIEKEEDGVPTTVGIHDKIWSDLFLERVALFPTLSEAKETSKLRLEEGDLGPMGTTPWFEGHRPHNIPQEVYHMDRLLLRMREWSQEASGLPVRFDAFAERFEAKAQTKENIHKYSDHRTEMIKKIIGGKWIDEACAHMEQKLQAKEANERERRDKEEVARLEMVSRFAKMNEELSTIDEPPGKFFTPVPDEEVVEKTSLEARKQRLLEKKRQMNLQANVPDVPDIKVAEERRRRLLERKKQMLQSKNHTKVDHEDIGAPAPSNSETLQGLDRDAIVPENMVERRKRLLAKKRLIKTN